MEALKENTQHAHILETVRHFRHQRGHCLGDLLGKYGAPDTVEALGSRYLTHTLGLDVDPEDYDEDMQMRDGYYFGWLR